MQKTKCLAAEFVNLEFFSLINIRLISVSNLPKLPRLKKLEFEGLDILLEKFLNPAHLNLSGHNLKDSSNLELLKHVDFLKSLAL